jgi:AraC-like DNA-binding protein
MIPCDDRSVLASRAGMYREAPPIAALRAHFSHVWTNTVPGDRPIRASVVPDGCVDLLWRDGRFVVVGPDVSAANPILSPGTVVGLRFRPGAAASWLGLPLDEIVGCERPMTDFWKSKAAEVADRLGGLAMPRELVSVFQQIMSGLAAGFEAPPPEASAIFGLLKSENDNGEGRVAYLRDRLDMSERTLRRWSRRYFGYGPKTLDRVLRLQRFQNLAKCETSDPLAGLAVEAGYADQAHLGREVQALCGMTAGEFVRQLAPPPNGRVLA